MNGLLSPLLRHMRLSLVGPELKGKVLDYGCGEGVLYSYAKVSDYTGVDIDRDVLAVGSKKYPALRFYHIDEFKNSNETFDTISSIATLGLLDSKLDFLKTMKRHLNDNGRIVLTTPHPRANWIHQMGAKLGIFGNDGYKKSEQLVDRSQMEQLAAEAGLHVKEVRTFMFGVNQLFILTPSNKT